MQDNFSDSAPALGQLGALTAALVIGTNLAASYWPHMAGYLLFTAAALLVLELGLWLAEKLCRWFLHRSPQGLLGLGLLVLSIAYTVRRGAGEGLTWRVLLFSGLSAGALGLLAVSWWSLLRWRRLTPWTGAAALLSACAVGMLATLLLTDGFQDPMVRRYLALSEPQEPAALLEAGLGPFPTATLDYGPEGAVEAGTVDLTDYMNRDTGNLVGHYVDAYWDYGLNEVPLRGRVWYPAEGQSCPVLFLAHGNHGITTPSYQGYDYLGAYLASYGYVVVSVDQNACNMLTGENDGRAVLLLEHIGLLLDYNRQRENPLYGKIDPDCIAIAGHSRGGEMVATAYLFNGYDCYPENGAIEFDYHYNIRSIIAIAPTVDQYRPADHSVALEDVNYLLLHGSADRDVTSFQGMAQYENVAFTGRGDYLKSALYIAGANHGQFNSLWGAYDQTGSFAPFLNMESLLDQADQQRIACLFIKAFLDVTLREDDTHRALLTDWDSYRSQLPETVYVQCWESSGFTPVADFEEDSDLKTGTLEGSSISAESMRLWTEELAGFGGSDTHAARLRWTWRGKYAVAFPETDLTDRDVSFDICDLDSAAIRRGDLNLVDGELVLTDAEGRTASARIRDFATIFPILPVWTDKLDFLFGTQAYKRAFATVTVPAEGFAAQGEFNPSQVVQISFAFDGSGEVLLDNIGFEAHTGRGVADA